MQDELSARDQAVLLRVLRHREALWDDPEARDACFRMVRLVADPDDPVHEMDGFAGLDDFHATTFSYRFTVDSPQLLIRACFREGGWAPEALEDALWASTNVLARIDQFDESRDAPIDMAVRSVMARGVQEKLRHLDRLEAVGTPVAIGTARALRLEVESHADPSRIDELVELLRTHPPLLTLGPDEPSLLPERFGYELLRGRVDGALEILALRIGTEGWDASSWLAVRRDALLEDPPDADWLRLAFSNAEPLLAELQRLVADVDRAWMLCDIALGDYRYADAGARLAELPEALRGPAEDRWASIYVLLSRVGEDPGAAVELRRLVEAHPDLADPLFGTMNRDMDLYEAMDGVFPR